MIGEQLYELNRLLQESKGVSLETLLKDPRIKKLDQTDLKRFNRFIEDYKEYGDNDDLLLAKKFLDRYVPIQTPEEEKTSEIYDKIIEILKKSRGDTDTKAKKEGIAGEKYLKALYSDIKKKLDKAFPKVFTKRNYETISRSSRDRFKTVMDEADYLTDAAVKKLKKMGKF